MNKRNHMKMQKPVIFAKKISKIDMLKLKVRDYYY